MSTDGQGTLWRRNIAENFNHLSRAHERYRRQTTDGRTMTYSEHELESTFANKTIQVEVRAYEKKNRNRKSCMTCFSTATTHCHCYFCALCINTLTYLPTLPIECHWWRSYRSVTAVVTSHQSS